MRTITTKALVEINLPDMMEAFDLETELDTLVTYGSVKIALFLDLDDVVLKVPPVATVGGIGQSRMGSNEGGRVITIKKLRLRSIQGDMLPTYSDDGKTMTFFTVDKTDDPIVVIDDKGGVN